jgi:SAM-dependent methyltransferase
MTENEPLEQLISAWKQEEQAPFSGWDFDYLKDRWQEASPPWSYEALVRELLPQATAVLDIGTGGGERLAAYQAIFPARVAATEGYHPNFLLARSRLEALGVEVKEAETSLSARLPFEDSSFDLVIDRHSAFNIAEVERVLQPGGIFLTQQVDGNNLSDLSDVFGVKQPWTNFTLDFVLNCIKETNLTVELAEEWAGPSVFRDVGAVVYFLKAVPWIVEGFSVAGYLPELKQIQARLAVDGELVFTQKLKVIRAVKPTK